ncbi:MAG: 30S ribosomal protein S17e [Candidatus Aenigmarchaeota archaeon]|nr:30S ribosomal protein S17e [Candidatus Aenigmarchaeota archaeon]
MGSIKATAIKVLTNEIFSKNKGKFSEKFDENKKALGEVLQIRSKRVRNSIAGYITRLAKNSKKVYPKYRPRQDTQDIKRKRIQRR